MLLQDYMLKERLKQLLNGKWNWTELQKSNSRSNVSKMSTGGRYDFIQSFYSLYKILAFPNEPIHF